MPALAPVLRPPLGAAASPVLVGAEAGAVEFTLVAELTLVAGLVLVVVLEEVVLGEVSRLQVVGFRVVS